VTVSREPNDWSNLLTTAINLRGCGGWENIESCHVESFCGWLRYLPKLRLLHKHKHKTSDYQHQQVLERRGQRDKCHENVELTFWKLHAYVSLPHSVLWRRLRAIDILTCSEIEGAWPLLLPFSVPQTDRRYPTKADLE
jgi:hypothetical protein